MLYLYERFIAAAAVARPKRAAFRGHALPRGWGKCGLRSTWPRSLQGNVLRQLVDELADHLDPLSALRATGHDNTPPALSNARWFIDKGVPRMSSEFILPDGNDRCSVHRNLTLVRISRDCGTILPLLARGQAVVGSHQSLRVTPAMEAGITDHVWSIEEIAKLFEIESVTLR